MMNIEKVVFGGGCFWCTEAVFRMIRGVVSVAPGYAGGDVENPTYEDVSSGTTGHAEVIQITYDPSKVSYKDLLTVFFATHNPTTLNQQGNDVGDQYRSVIFYSNPMQEEVARHFIAELSQEDAYAEKPIVTQIEELPAFYEAEEYHKNYYENNSSQPYCQIIIAPKVEQAKQQLLSDMKDQRSGRGLPGKIMDREIRGNAHVDSEFGKI